jgi:hypothetical protein
VGEICANDDGRSSFSGGRRFLTFKKAIINCYVPDYEMFHVKYTEIRKKRDIYISEIFFLT